MKQPQRSNSTIGGGTLPRDFNADPSIHEGVSFGELMGHGPAAPKAGGVDHAAVAAHLAGLFFNAGVQLSMAQHNPAAQAKVHAMITPELLATLRHFGNLPEHKPTDTLAKSKPVDYATAHVDIPANQAPQNAPHLPMGGSIEMPTPHYSDPAGGGGDGQVGGPPKPSKPGDSVLK